MSCWHQTRLPRYSNSASPHQTIEQAAATTQHNTTPHKLPGFGQAGHSKPTAKDRTPRKEELSGKDRGRVFYKQKTLATHLTI